MDELPNPIMFYDGVCGLCNRLVQFTLKRDRGQLFRFAPLQSDFAAEWLARYGKDASDLDTIYVLTDPGLPTERILSKGRAWMYVLHRLGGFWKAVALMRLLPDWLLDLGYDLVASNRYRIFGRYDSCPLPDPQWQHRFTGLDESSSGATGHIPEAMELQEKLLRESRTIAVVGLSPRPDRDSHEVAQYLKEVGYRIIPVNPAIAEVLGEKSYPDLLSIPEPVDLVDVFRRPEHVPPVAEEAIKIGAKFLWLQDGIVNEEAAARAREAGLEVVMDDCTMRVHQRLSSQGRI